MVKMPYALFCLGFQFIGFPSEWGACVTEPSVAILGVSNLLGSPASGENDPNELGLGLMTCFQFIGFPSEWGGGRRS